MIVKMLTHLHMMVNTWSVSTFAKVVKKVKKRRRS
jgi:hypothetical protein